MTIQKMGWIFARPFLFFSFGLLNVRVEANDDNYYCVVVAYM